jgi:hypothetical protein
MIAHWYNELDKALPPVREHGQHDPQLLSRSRFNLARFEEGSQRV